MTGPTHLLGGNVAYLLVAWSTGHPPRLSEALVAMSAALLPNLDHAGRQLGRVFPTFATQLATLFGHRTATHSLLAVVIITILTTPLPDGLRLAVISGVASHALLDMMTPTGVAWFWPLQRRCVFPGDRRWRMAASGKGELGFAVVLMLMTGPLAVAGERGVGMLGSIRDALGDLTQARRYYDDHRSEAAWWLILDGLDNRRRTAISGRYKVVAGYRSDGLLIETTSGIRSVCRSEACDWHATRATLERGQPEQTTTRWLRAQQITPEALLDAIDPLHAVGELYLLGELTGHRLRSDAPTLTLTSTSDLLDRAQLHYATPMQLLHQPGPFHSINILIQVRHPPGSHVPEPQQPTINTQSRIDPRLRRYLP